MVLQYIYSNNSVEEGYETREVTNKNKKLYFYLAIIKIKKTNFLIYEHYNDNNHSCINGYKSYDKVNKNNFMFIFVHENDE